ncbi:hypothetical protein ARAM_001211 [Aspergillus rambellii]|uniref:Chromo domain-containing protein n=1 Tax=Aspergillus rambellii TaxID=308745 RepID=A0A0F8WLX6_9EURO|nr:hypothetical protein ARAM_001211 [Aspergillus rambellii]
MGNTSDDDISLASTVESDQESEYEVETILAEYEFEDGIRYLVQWTGYPIERCTWEPRRSFGAVQILRDWETKKQDIAQGRCSAFDVASWEARLLQLEEDRQERKRKRAAKRRKAEIAATSQEANPPKKLSSTDRAGKDGDSGPTAPDPPESGSSRDYEQLQSSRRGQLFSQASKPPPVLFGTSQVAPKSIRPKKAHNTTHTPKPYKLSTRRRYEKSKNDEPAPNIRQLDLRRPSDWTSLSPNITVPFENSKLTSLDTNGVEQYQVENNEFESAVDALISAESSRALVAESPHSIYPLATNSKAQSSSELGRTPRSSYQHGGTVISENGCTASFFKRNPHADSRSSRSFPDRWWNFNELFVTMYFGPERTAIGHTRICGFEYGALKPIYKTKKNHRIEVWFRHLCTLGEYTTLCGHRLNQKYANGWVEGFDDTEPEIYKAAENLRRKNLIAICYLSKGQNNVLLAYPPQSPDFHFLDDGSTSQLAPRYLNLVLRSSLAPISQLGLTGKESNEIRPRDLAIGGQSKAARENESIITPSIAHNNSGLINANHPKSAVDYNKPMAPNSPMHKKKSSVQMSAQPSNFPGQELENISTDPMDIDIQATGPPTNAPGLLHSLDLNKPLDMDELFRRAFDMTFDVLSNPSGTKKMQRVEMFYLWFPGDSELIRTERELMMTFLKKYTSLVYSHCVEDDWEKFVTTCKKNIQGVVLFHESFVDYHTIPLFKELLKKATGYWNVSLSQPLKHVDGPLHFQRLFPHGGVFLITEDFMVHESRATLIILYWFYEWTKKKFPGSWKIMFRPDILHWLLKQPEPSDKSRAGIWLTMYHLIAQLGASSSTDHGILPGVEDADHESNVISPPSIPLYGSRKEDDSPDIPKGLSQECRNTDHLAEFFAGWGLVNSHRFRRFAMVTTLEPLPRWKNWEHLEIRHGAKDFMLTYAVDYKGIWAKLTGGNSMPNSNPNPSAAHTPYTPRTPKPHPVSSTSTSTSSKRSGSSLAQPLLITPVQLESSEQSHPQPYQ